MRGERTSAAAGCPDAPPVPVRPPDVPGNGAPAVAVVRTPRGWAVVEATGAHAVASLVEGLSLADLIGEELGDQPEPDRTARRSARGPAAATTEDEDPRDARIAALERTVAQLEHALAARVSTERAIGVLAERAGITPRAAFEGLRSEARSSGRPVHELAREVLESLADGLAAEPASPSAPERRCQEPVPGAPGPGMVVTGVNGAAPPLPRPPFPRGVEHTRPRFGAAPGATGDGRS